MVHSLIDHGSITYTAIRCTPGRADRRDHDGTGAVAWTAAAGDFRVEVLEAGLVQRSRAAMPSSRTLRALACSPRVSAPEMLFAHPGVRAANGSDAWAPQLFMHACDQPVARQDFSGQRRGRRAPRTPAACDGRRRVVAPFPICTRNWRRDPPHRSPRRSGALIDAAPVSPRTPWWCSAGIYSETAFDQAYLATLLGFPLVKRGPGGARRQAVDAFAGHAEATLTSFAASCPLRGSTGSRADSGIGVVGLVGSAAPPGTVTVVQHAGRRHLENPRPVALPAAAIQRLLDENRCAHRSGLLGGIASEQPHLLANVSSLLIKSTVSREITVGPTLSSGTTGRSGGAYQAMPWQWVGQGAAAVLVGATNHAGVLSSAGVGMRLFTVAQRSDLRAR